MRARLLLVLTTLLLAVGAPAALAQSVLIHPFQGQDLLLGTAIADRAAAALQRSAAELEVVGPLIAPSIVPPLAVQGGFLNPLALLGPEGTAGPTGAALLRSTTGVDLAVSGSLTIADEELQLEVALAERDGGRRLLLRAPQDEPERLAGAVARTVAAHLGLAPPEAVAPFELDGGYGDYVRAVTLVGAGFPEQAQAQLQAAAEAEALPPQGERLLRDLEALAAGEPGSDPLRMAVLSLSAESFSEGQALVYFEEAERASSLPAVPVWLGVLHAALDDPEAATAAFDGVAYPYGAAVRAAFRISRLQAAGEEALASLARGAEDDVGTLLAQALLANEVADVEVEKSALQHLTRVAPSFAYPFERLSFIAFDQDEPLAAAEALAVAVELEPDSDLYWTNLGWAYYLVGLLDESEAASRRALELDPLQAVARYNLGLALVVRDRLEEAMRTYEEALRVDPEVDDEAVGDLERARREYPAAAGVHFALARLYEAEGRRGEAADAYEAFLRELGPDAPAVPAAFVEAARERVTVLRAPPPPMEVSGGIVLQLGAVPLDGPVHPGDPLVPSFELYTVGEALPEQAEVRVELLDADGVPLVASEQLVDIPAGAVGFVVDELMLELPDLLAEGDYTLELSASAAEVREARARTAVTVRGEPQLLRKLIGRNIVMTSLRGGTLYGARDLGRPELLVERLLTELRDTAGAAAEALPVVSSGRFEGLDGGELFNTSEADDVRDFLVFLLAQGTRDTSFAFVDAYAQWALDGAPLPEG